MVDTISGLPVHVLVVHLLVVGVPLMALVTLAVAVRARWRPLAPWVLGADALLFVAAVVGRQSGKALQERLSRLTGTTVAETHGQRGTLLPWFVLALVVAAGLLWAATRRGGVLVPVAVAVSVVAGVAAVGWTVVVGDSGARAVWEQTIANTSPP
jgi:hypothetical protein